MGINMRLQLPQTVGQQDPTVETGMPLIANCKDFDNGRATYGAGNRSGLVSGIIASQIIYGGVSDAVKRSACPPDSVTVGHVVVVKVVLQFLNDNPAKLNLWRQLGDATSRAGIPCRQSKPALKRPAGATKGKVASHSDADLVMGAPHQAFPCPSAN